MKTWLITGCSTGLGRHLAQEVLSRGDQVVVTARRSATVADLAERYRGQVLALSLDVTREWQIRRAVAAAEAHFGGIDVLVNNAGVTYFGAVEESCESDVRRMFDVNFFGLANVTRAVLPGMRARRSGLIVNISSAAAIRPLPSLGYYSATKAAVEGLSEALAQETEPLGIKVMMVESGPFRTSWAGRSAGEVEEAAEIEDYVGTAGVQRTFFRFMSGKEPGDPACAADAIANSVNSEEPPRRLLLGSAAYGFATARVNELQHQFASWQPLSREAAYPEAC